jgi:hypothetical protein
MKMWNRKELEDIVERLVKWTLGDKLLVSAEVTTKAIELEKILITKGSPKPEEYRDYTMLITEEPKKPEGENWKVHEAYVYSLDYEKADLHPHYYLGWISALMWVTAEKDNIERDEDMKSEEEIKEELITNTESFIHVAKNYPEDLRRFRFNRDELNEEFLTGFHEGLEFSIGKLD